MAPDRIEKEILIDAPVDVVWRAVTQPDQMDRWLSERADFEPRPGTDGRIRMSETTTYNISVEAVEEHRRFAFRWAQPDGSRANERNSTLVEFTLHPQGDRTLLRVVESGFDRIDWSDSAKREFIEGHDSGWPRLIGRLGDLVASKS